MLVRMVLDAFVSRVMGTNLVSVPLSVRVRSCASYKAIVLIALIFCFARVDLVRSPVTSLCHEDLSNG